MCSGECVIWTGSKNADGYGTVRVNGKTYYAHRVTYERERGPIPPGMDLDHLCRVRACVNAEHLEPVTRRENTLRGEHPNIVAHRAGTCRRGHGSEHFYRRARGPRAGQVAYCRVCYAERKQRARG